MTQGGRGDVCQSIIPGSASPVHPAETNLGSLEITPCQKDAWGPSERSEANLDNVKKKAGLWQETLWAKPVHGREAVNYAD